MSFASFGPCLLIGFALALFSGSASAEEGLRRHALLVSAEGGGEGRVPLRFAAHDAQAVAQVLAELGGVDPRDAVIVNHATVASLEAGINEIRRRVLRLSATKRRQEVIFYYSGHSDEQGLLLSEGHLPYKRLKQLVADLPVDVRLMILDSCASGQLTLSKGGIRRAPFLIDESVHAKGNAVITSASADEAAQESERIRGSFFTHYFVSGLRGAADVNGDHRVTLNEAYQYAYANTLARTETTRGGAQHPSYDFQLAGTGDLILTDLRASPATLDFPEDLGGRYFIRDKSHELVAEIHKQPGRPMQLGLEPGAYSIIHDDRGQYEEGSIEFAGATHEINIAEVKFASVTGEAAVARGPAKPREYIQKRWSFQLYPDFDDKAAEAGEEHQFMFGLLGGRSGKLHGVSLAVGGTQVDEGGATGVMIAFGVNYDKGEMAGGQVAYGLNYAGGPVSGFQVGVVDWAGQDLTGAQMGMVAVGKGSVEGLQAAFVSVAKGDFMGAQAGYAAVTTGSLTGAQFGTVDYAGAVKGLQAGMVNYAGAIKGAQVGMIDVSQTVDGAQIGLGNVATDAVDWQLGLVNYATKVNHESLGLISFAGNGVLDGELWTDELHFVHASIRMGSKHIYTIYDMADRSATAKNVDYHYDQTYGLGLGTHQTFGDFSVGLEALGEYIPNKESTNYIRGQADVGYRLFAGLEVYGGPSYSAYLHPKDEFVTTIGQGYHGKLRTTEHTTRWIGAGIGLRYQFLSH